MWDEKAELDRVANFLTEAERILKSVNPTLEDVGFMSREQNLAVAELLVLECERILEIIIEKSKTTASTSTC